jgi:ribose transport system ATP-binding protein
MNEPPAAREAIVTEAPALPVVPVAVSARHLSKTFSGVTVLRDVSLDIGRGEIVALIGQNGSGKSTFIKILSGYHPADPGATLEVGSRDVTGILHEGSSKTGLAFIHQDVVLVESMTILENLRITQFKTGFARRILWREEEAEVRRMLAKVGLDVAPSMRVADLPVTERALVAIARGLAEIESGESLGARMLVLDEPTAYLPRGGVERLFGVIKSLAAEGTSILFVSHRLDEVLEHCDRAIVFRAGELVADIPTTGKTERDLVELMLGRPPEDMYPEHVTAVGENILSVAALCGGSVVDVNFAADAGNIIGFIGLPGSGYEELPYLLAGANQIEAGEIELAGRPLPIRGHDSASAIRNRIAFLPADRKGSSGAIELKVGENLTIAMLSAFTRVAGMLNHVQERATVAEQLALFGVTPGRGNAPLATLSGGNQQKVLIAKWAITDPTVLILHEPTQGVDVGAKRDVFAHVSALASRGAVVLISSVEYEDLANMCHRVHVLRDGKIVQTIERGDLSGHDLAVAVYAR